MAPSAKVADALASVQAAPDKGAAYQSILTRFKELSSPSTAADDLFSIAESFFTASLGVVATRSVLDIFVSTLRGAANDDLWIDVGTRTLALLNAQQSAFPEAAANIMELVATAHENNEDNEDAAKILAEIPLDSSQRMVTVTQRAELWIRIVRNYLEVDETTKAEIFINKLKNIMHQVQDQKLALMFNLSQARILDAQRNFLQAANRYHEISFSLVVAEDDRLHTLSMAAKCAILAPAGPLRSRTLGRLHKDDRAPYLDDFGFLEKIFLDRLVSPAEVEKFAEGLAPHQLATTADGSTVLAKAVVEHNLLSASRLYRNIKFDALGVLLGLEATKAEETTARMIEQGRLVGRIDQLDGIIYFEGGEASGEKGSGRAEVIVGKEMRRWDANVESLAEEVENITNALHQRFPVGFCVFNVPCESSLTPSGIRGSESRGLERSRRRWHSWRSGWHEA